MSLELMKKRITHSGRTPREEMIRDGQNITKEELEHDSSYSTTTYIYDPYNKVDEGLANVRLYGRSYSAINGNYIKFLTTHDNPLKVGEYLHDIKDDTYWLVYNSFNVNDIHYEGKLVQCNYLLKWQTDDGKIIERWANIVSASKYDVGETGNTSVVMASNNFTVMIGYCDEGLELEDKRVFIDKRKIPKKVFKMTRADDILYDFFGIGAMLGFIADRNTFNPNTDNQVLGICDYIDINAISKNDLDEDVSDNYLTDSSNKMTILTSVINGVANIKIGTQRTYTATIKDCMGDTIEWDETFSWNINSENEIISEETGNKIKINVDDESLIGSSFLLSVLRENEVIVEKTINIIALA